MDGEKILILDAFDEEIVVALLDSGTICEAARLPKEDAPRLGDVFVGRVQRVQPGVDAAFIDVGLERNAFLQLSDGDPPLKGGQDVLVQVVKRPEGDKGVRVTRNLMLAGELLGFSPLGGKAGISSKIVDNAERARLKRIADAHCPQKDGWMFRTAAEGRSEADLLAERDGLLARWETLRRDAAYRRAPSLLLEAPHPAERFVYDLLHTAPTRILVSDASWLERVRSLCRFALPVAIEMYTGETPLRMLFPVQSTLERAGRRKVWLPGGGYLVFDTCEAMTVIDVNVGKQAEKQNLENTALRVNLEAAREIATQLRLRDIGGIVVIDAIDLREAAHREQLLAELNEAFASDRGKPEIHGGISTLGLIQLTRKRLYAAPKKSRG